MAIGETDDSGMDSPSDLDDSDEDFHNSNPGSGVDDSGPKVEDGTHHQRGKDDSGSGRHGGGRRPITIPNNITTYNFREVADRSPPFII